jgi:PII-like signaling protein
MKLDGVGKRVRIYIGESDQWHGAPLYLRILEKLKSEGCAGGTVLRGIAGFGAHSLIHTATILRLSEDLPVIVEWIDTEERITRVLPTITAMVGEGLITVDAVEIILYQHRTLT